MLFDEDQYKLQGELYDVNQRIADQANTLQDHFLSKSGRETLSQIWSVFLPRQIEDQIPLESAAKAFISILDLHPALQGPPISRVGRPLFPDQPGYLPSASEEAGKILLFGSIYLGISGQIDGPYFDKLWEIIAGADIVNTLLRNVLTGKPFNPDPLPIPEKLPKQLVDFIRDFESRFCLAGVRDAYIGFGAAQQAWNPSSNAKGITSLDPTSGCAGQSVTIRGVGFGASRPQGSEVFFPSRDVGCIPAKILRHGWTDTAIAAR